MLISGNDCFELVDYCDWLRWEDLNGLSFYSVHFFSFMSEDVRGIQLHLGCAK
jgi:hypothetical protein